MIKKNKIQTGFRLPPDLLKAFRIKAEKEYKNVTQKIIQLMMDYVKSK